MKRLILVAVIAVLATAVSSATPLCGGAQDVQVAGFHCDIGGLYFSNFLVVPATPGLTPSMTLVTASASSGWVDLRFNPSLASQAGPADIWFYFTVTGGVNGIDLTVGGTNASVNEIACSEPVTQDNVCPTGTLLGNLLVFSGGSGEVMFPGGTMVSPIYVFKNILVQGPGELSSFTESFHVPEPISLVLIGSGLLGLGLLRRRARS